MPPDSDPPTSQRSFGAPSQRRFDTPETSKRISAGTRQAGERGTATSNTRGCRQEDRSMSAMSPNQNAEQRKPTPSLQDVLDSLCRGELDYKPGYIRKSQGSFGKIAALMYHGMPLCEIPADLAMFDALWRWEAGRRLPGKFTNSAHFLKVRSEIRGPLSKFLGETAWRAALRQADDDWRVILDHLNKAIEDPTSPFHGRCSIPLQTLARLARDDHRQPRDIDSAWVGRCLSSVSKNGTRQSFCCGVRLLIALQEQRGNGLADVLPAGPLQLPTIGRRIRQNIPVPAYHDRIEEWLEHKARGRIAKASGLPIDPVEARTIQKYRESIAWLITCQIELGFLDPAAPPPIETIADPDRLWACAIAEAQHKRPWQPLKPSTLKMHLSQVFPFLRNLDPRVVEVEDELHDDPYFADVGEMTQSTKEFCIDFIADERKQARLFTLPVTLQKMAEEQLQNWDSLSRAQRFSALGLAIAAAEGAIITFLPLRSENVDDLTITGPEAHIRRQGRSRSEILEIHLPALFVKNKLPIDHEIEPTSYCNSRSIIDWFIDGPRERIAEMFCNAELDMDRLFCGIGYQRFHRYWSRATALVGVPMSQHRVRHAIASFLLLEDEGRMAFVAAILRIEEETARRYYAFIDEMRRLRRAHTYHVRQAEAVVARHGASVLGRGAAGRGVAK